MTTIDACSQAMDAPVEAQPTVETAFDNCSRALYRYFLVRTGGDSHLADDFMQQLWLQVNRSPRTVSGEEIEYYLRGVARNLVRIHWRQQASRPSQVPISDPQLAAELSDALVSSDFNPAILEKQEAQDQLMLALTNLGSADQALIIGHYFNEQPHAELASQLGISPRAVEGRLYRARRALRAALGNLED